MPIFSTRNDLALDRDDHAQFLTLLVAFMVFLATATTVGVGWVNRAADRWDTEIRDTLTVQVGPAATVEAANRALGNALQIVRATPGVVSARPVSEQRVLELLQPWLGGLADEADLPLPKLIDVTVDHDRVDVPALSRRLALAVPGAGVDDHRVWLQRLVRLLSAVKWAGLAVLGLIILVTGGTVVFAARTGLAVHREAIEVLHLIGAHDAYIARQFAVRALRLGFRGGMIGLAVALPTLFGLGALAQALRSAVIAGPGIGALTWVAIAAMPVVAALIAMLTTQLTVLRNLSRRF